MQKQSSDILSFRETDRKAARLETVKRYVDGIFSSLPEAEKKAAYVHSYGVACTAAILADRRGLDRNLAYCIGLLHDIYSYRTGCFWLCHAFNGAELLKVAFRRELNRCFSDEEARVVLRAVYRHSAKEYIHDSYDELLKDADLLQNSGHNLTDNGFVTDRLMAVYRELGIPTKEKFSARSLKPNFGFRRERFASIAAEYASKNIRGEKNDTFFREIIQYFPEDDAEEEFRSAWCAAFVYHCAVNAGLEIPIRCRPDAAFRLACVPAWQEWGKAEGLLLNLKTTKPIAGDIILFCCGGGYTHTGIVTQTDDEGFVLAEGNADWSNVSRLARASFNSERDLILRIPENYIYNGLDYAPN